MGIILVNMLHYKIYNSWLWSSEVASVFSGGIMKFWKQNFYLFWFEMPYFLFYEEGNISTLKRFREITKRKIMKKKKSNPHSKRLEIIEIIFIK